MQLFSVHVILEQLKYWSQGESNRKLPGGFFREGYNSNQNLPDGLILAIHAKCRHK